MGIARVQLSPSRLDPEQTRSEARRAQPPQREGARARGESGSAGEGAAHRPYDPGRPGKSCRAAGIQPRTREGLLMAVQPLASQVGVAPACRGAGGATGFLLPSSEARSRASAAPSYARPGPVCVRTRARPRRARQPALRRSVTGPSPSAGRSSPGTTPSTAMPGSRCSPPMMSIITEHRMCWLSADVPCKPPGPFTPNASSTAPRNPPRFPKPSGSTHPPLPQQEKRVSK